MVCIEKRPQNVAVHQPLVLNISPVYLTGGISGTYHCPTDVLTFHRLPAMHLTSASIQADFLPQTVVIAGTHLSVLILRSILYVWSG